MDKRVKAKYIKNGYLLIININQFLYNDERIGSEHDVFNMKELFKNKFGFEVRVERDTTFLKFPNIINKFIGEANRAKCDLIIIAIMSHGGLGDYFYASNVPKKIYLNDLRNM